uniref:ORF57 n=1 Tax=Nitrosopumilaceae spindle-shaped virus TaxID=3065433 RepID=A0AAT9JA70_9VIRU
MKHNLPEIFAGWSFMFTGLLCMVMVVIVSSGKNTSFIYDDELFRVFVIGLIVCLSGFILISISKIITTLQSSKNVEVE